MKILSALRQVDAAERELAGMCTQLRKVGYQPELSRPVPGARYLRFHGQFDDKAEITGLLDLGAWAKKALPQLDGVDWLSMEDAVVQPLVHEHPLILALSHQHAPFRKVRVVELVSDFGQKNHAADFPSLDASPGAILIEQYVPHFSAETSEFDLPTPLTFSLGYSVLPFDALTSLEVGDVLLIEHMEGRLSCNGKSLFTIELNQETIMILDSDDSNENNQHKLQEPSAPGVTGLNSLPVELSFVLLEKIVPYSELNTITPGEIVELPPSAMQQVEIRANKRSIARGELVQLANGQLGVEIRTLWQHE